jgi:hypothetical protein
VKGVSEAIFYSAASQFSLTVYESTGLWGLTNPFSPVKRVSRATFEWAAIKFSLTVSESTGAVWAHKSIHHP